MKISVFGLGYVGAVSGACLAMMGHQVIGVDPNALKVEMVNRGESPVIEKGFQEVMGEVASKKLFIATTDPKYAVEETDLAFICVGTPSRTNGSIDLKYVKRVAEHIGSTLKNKKDYFVACVRSTVMPGSVEETVIPTLEKTSGKKAGQDFGVCMIPEFLREGSSVYDFYHPPRNVIGEFDRKSGDVPAELFKSIKAPLVRTKIRTAEILKYTDNSFHALKITFANEIGNLCKELHIDSHEVMEIFCMDQKLNLSSYYLKPGFAFGGSCLPKDLRALTYEFKTRDLDAPVLNSIMESNQKQIMKVVKKLLKHKGQSLGFLGLSFKAGTDDLRESPIVELIEAMIGKGFTIKIYDKFVSLARLVGANKEYIEKEIPHISSLMCSTAQELIQSSDVIVIGNHSDEFRETLLSFSNPGQLIIDLVRILRNDDAIAADYDGLCW
jgi:GDP-mannose 6-dehydrogenase